MVCIKRVERNKRKYVTVVSGLEAHGMDLKKVAKEFGYVYTSGREREREILMPIFFAGRNSPREAALRKQPAVERRSSCKGTTVMTSSIGW